uniref:Response regulatory domain-containing protein n=1 Tax=Leersia perrieri TaxID=77586 RepID=A0A0D9XHG8_9ORYZ
MKKEKHADIKVKEEKEERKPNEVLKHAPPMLPYQSGKLLPQKRSRSETISGSNPHLYAPQHSPTDACKKQKSEVYYLPLLSPSALSEPSCFSMDRGLFPFPVMGSKGAEGRDDEQGLGSSQEFGDLPFLDRKMNTMPEGFLMRMRVLVVDNDESNLTSLSQMLIGFLCHVTTCLRGAEALAMLVDRRDNFDLVLSEAHMPDMNMFILTEHVGLKMYVPVAVKPIAEEELKTLIFHVSRIKLCNNYNELVQSTSLYHFGQRRQVSNPRMGKAQQKEEISGYTISISSVILAVLFLTKLRRFETRFTRVKEETSGSKSNSYIEFVQSTSTYQSGQSRQLSNPHKCKTEWKVPSRIKSPNMKKFSSAILAIIFILRLTFLTRLDRLKEVSSRQCKAFSTAFLAILFLAKLRRLKISKSETRFKRVIIFGSTSRNDNRLVRPMPTSIYFSGQSRQVGIPHLVKARWRILFCVAIFVAQLRGLKMSRSKTRLTRVKEEEISGSKTLRFVWTPAFHERFINVILRQGLYKADPQKVMDLMDVEGLSREIIAIHLKKYHLSLKRLAHIYHLSLKRLAHIPLSKAVSDIHGDTRPAGFWIQDINKAKLLQEVRDSVYYVNEHQFVTESIRLQSNMVPEEYMTFSYQKEFNKLMELLGVSPRIAINRNKAGPENVSVLPLVGHGGVGKTTLALQIFNDKNVLDYFDRRCWISASEVFHEQDLIKKFIRAVAECEMESDDLGCIQRVLTGGIVDQSKRFLFVVDNIQECACDGISAGWMGSLSILQHAKFGSMVLMTTRSMKVANTFGTMNAFLLGGFPEVTLWKFLKICAFGSDTFISNHFLEDIGRRIVEKLNGIPFAAKILGRLLSLHLSSEFWSNILRSELWEWPEEETGVSPYLLLSYQYLPSHLKQCFSFCSTYPKGYKFDKDILVDCWEAVGLVVAHKKIPIQDVGGSYFDQLVNRSFFQKIPSSSKYVMNDMLHDMALVVAKNECIMIRDKTDLLMVHPNILHLSVHSKSCLDLGSLESLSRYNKLRSLVCNGVDSSIITRAAEVWFHKLREVRMLSFDCCQLKELPESIGNLKYLRYLNISSCTFDKLPSSFWCLSKLEILYAHGCTFQHLPKDITKLTNLRRVKLNDSLTNQFRYMPEVGKLQFLQELPYFDVGNEHGRYIGELKNMNHVVGSLEISGLVNVMSKDEAAEAQLHQKNYLDTLILSWDESVTTYTKQLITGLALEIIEGLCPSYYLKHLGIKCYKGFELHPSWFNKEKLHCLSSISIYSCPNLVSLPFQSTASSCNRSITRFPWLTKLSISRCRKLTSLAKFLESDCFPAMKSIHIEKCESLVSLPAQGFAGFAHLEEVEFSECWNLNWPPDLVFPSSLKELKLEACGDISESTFSCLHSLCALTTLKLQFCHLVKSIPAQAWSSLVSLENLTIFYCKGLQSVGGSEAIAKVENVDISDCPCLQDLVQPFRKGSNAQQYL